MTTSMAAYDTDAELLQSELGIQHAADVLSVE
jgi:hypothetical protein